MDCDSTTRGGTQSSQMARKSSEKNIRLFESGKLLGPDYLHREHLFSLRVVLTMPYNDG
jgi:hypothetical protein